MFLVGYMEPVRNNFSKFNIWNGIMEVVVSDECFNKKVRNIDNFKPKIHLKLLLGAGKHVCFGLKIHLIPL